MKTIRQLLLFSLLPTAFGLVSHAATHVVLPGQSLQTAINSAASGDTIVLPTTGAFPENITITGKALRLVTPYRGVTRITGNLDWLNVDHYHSLQMPFNTFLVDPAGLANGRSSKDKGPVDPIYRDHNGSRNDIGPNGGRNYMPNGRTTDKPIPIMFSASPIFVPSGGAVTIESTGATVK